MGQSSQTTNSSQNSNTTPWDVQAPYLSQGFAAAQQAMGTANANAVAPNGFVAQYTPGMLSAFQQELGATNGPLGGLPTTAASAGTTATNAGAGATQQGLFGLANFNPTGGTNYNINAANAYAGADAPNIQGAVQNAMLAGNQNFRDVTAPAIMRNAAGTGNINSTAPSVQQGIVQRGLAEQAANLGASLSNQDYMTGLGLANSQANSANQTSLQQLLGLTQGGTGALYSGANTNANAINTQSGLFNMANTGASNLLNANQADLNNQMQAWQFNENSPFASLNNYWNIVGNKMFGSNTTGTGTSTTTQQPSMLSTIGGGLGLLGSLF